MKVLVVDDDVDFAHSVEEVLQVLGHEVLLAHSEADACHILGAGASVEAALIDWALPDGVGRDVCGAVHAHNPSAVLILVSGFSAMTLDAELRALGSVHFVQKPVDWGTIQKVLAGAAAG